jgi:hypothetical protein
MIGTSAVQAKVYETLSAAGIEDIAGASLASDRFVDGAPSDVKLIEFPYVVIGDTQTLDDDVQGSAGVEEFITLHIWSRYRGQKEVKDIAAQITDRLHARTLIVSGFGSVIVSIQQLRVLEDPDGLTRHGVLTLHIHAFE